ncbi:MAG TPA: YbaK/EbsC family protein, partial [Microlunatus sp.]|nr:YbaK/EbsC family protein [Microlunatus sp.]
DLGNLTWLPAADHAHLLADPVSEALRTLDADLYVAEIDPSSADTAAFCQAYDVGLDQSANCVVVAGRRGETSTMAACLVLASGRADVNKTVRKHLDVRKISFAAMDDAVERTGMEYGGITPVGLPLAWPLLIDTAVAAQPWVVIGSGLRRSKIAVRGADLATLPRAEVLELTIASA